MTDRAYSTIAVKSLNEDERTFSGLATSPVPDRVSDIIEPLGCKYNNPTVLLRAHDHTMPIGQVRFDRPTKAGITFTARIPKIPEPGLLRDRCDMAWGEIRHGLIAAVSVGFRAIADPERLPSGGLRYTKTEIFELSTVAVPAQELATIDRIKAIDTAVRRAGGEGHAALATCPAIRLKRAPDGFQFQVVTIDRAGIEDFRTTSEHTDYGTALKDAQSRAESCKVPLQDLIDPGPVATALAAAPARSVADPPKALEQKTPSSSVIRPGMTLEDFKKSADYPIANPFRWQTECAKAEPVYDIWYDHVVSEMKGMGYDKRHAIAHASVYAALAEAKDLLRRIGMTVEALAQQGEMIERLAANVKALRPLQYTGVYQAGQRYFPGNFCTYEGSVWHCNAATDERPGSGCEAWTLAVKRGSHGKDLR